MTASSPRTPVLHSIPMHPLQAAQHQGCVPPDLLLSSLKRIGFRLQARLCARLRTESFLISPIHVGDALRFEDHSNTAGCAHADNFCPETDNADCD